MKNLTLAFFSLILFPLAYNAQVSDCVVDLVVEAYFEYVTVGSVDFPEGATLNWSINGDMMNNGSDVIELSFGLFLNGPVVVCVSFVSDECPEGVEICETLDLNDLIGGGDCPETLGSMNQSTGPCNWIFEVEGSGDGAEVTWNFGDASSEVSGFIADHHYAADGEYVVTAYYSDLSCEGVVLTTVISVEGCSGEVDCVDQDQIDNDMLCTQQYDPVCGCNNVTYSNDCYAYYYGGVTSWVQGECENQGCIYEDGTFYNVGSEVFLSECEYIYCESPNNWSSVIEIPDCEEDGGCWEEGQFYCVGCELFIDDCNYYECLNDDGNWSDLITIDDCGEDEFCPNNINVIYPKWDFCSWAFEVDTIWPNPKAGPPTWIEVIWDFGDGTVQTGTDFWSYNVYDSDGVYEVFVQYSDSNCPDGVELSVVIQVGGCGEGDCINQDQIDNEFQCTEEYNPVCGCDDVTYSNDCYAYYYGGVTSWEQGECTDSVGDIDGNPSWSVFPVPTSDLVTFKGLYVGTHFLKIYDNQGRIVKEESVSNGETISLKELINGWYTMQIIGLESSAKRVVIQR
ncbi:MAG TPA: T9SS type A sorting domain-containing protein [Flavobacteriales bacterium]|nr:T9SS type A sorting domain-containing protein [Flavobacteriales bacterium]